MIKAKDNSGDGTGLQQFTLLLKVTVDFGPDGDGCPEEVDLDENTILAVMSLMKSQDSCHQQLGNLLMGARDNRKTPERLKKMINLFLGWKEKSVVGRVVKEGRTVSGKEHIC
jgi:hypothetical protein